MSVICNLVFSDGYIRVVPAVPGLRVTGGGGGGGQLIYPAFSQ